MWDGSLIAFLFWCSYLVGTPKQECYPPTSVCLPSTFDCPFLGGEWRHQGLLGSTYQAGREPRAQLLWYFWARPSGLGSAFWPLFLFLLSLAQKKKKKEVLGVD